MPRPLRHSEQAYLLQETLTTLTRFKTAHKKINTALAEYARGITAGSLDSSRSIGSHTDPTGTQALLTDPDAETQQRVSQLIRTINNAARTLDDIRRNTLAPALPKQPHARGIVLCANLHGCPQDNYATKAGRCHTCYHYHHRTGRDRT